MNTIANFAFEEHLVRVVERDGEPWFVGKDVCGVLQIADYHQALDRLDDDERGRCSIPTPVTAGGPQEMIIISEPGVYRLVFRSRKPEAERFKRWLAHDVIPQIRKTGRFGAPEAAPAAPMLDMDAPLMARVATVRLAASLFGKARARSMWNDMGLPHVPDVPDEPVGIGDEAAVENGLACLNHLLEVSISFQPVSGHLADAHAGSEDARFILRRTGIRYEAQMFTDTAGFCVATRSPALRAQFAGTFWAAYGWGEALRRLPDVRLPTRRLMKFDKGFTSQSVFLPIHYAAPPLIDRN